MKLAGTDLGYLQSPLCKLRRPLPSQVDSFFGGGDYGSGQDKRERVCHCLSEWMKVGLITVTLLFSLFCVVLLG